MCTFDDNSDKLNKWSDYERSSQHLSATKAQTLVPTLTLPRHCLTQGLPYRNLQTLRQTRLQVHEGARTRTQILPLCQLPRPQAGDDLYSQSTKRQGTGLFEQSSQHQSDLGGDLRNQSGTDITARHILNVSFYTTAHHRQYRRMRCYCGEYDCGFSHTITNQGALL